MTIKSLPINDIPVDDEEEEEDFDADADDDGQSI